MAPVRATMLANGEYVQRRDHTGPCAKMKS